MTVILCYWRNEFQTKGSALEGRSEKDLDVKSELVFRDYFKI